MCQNATQAAIVSGENQREQGRHSEQERIGLCADCQHMRRIESARGSPFYLCQLSATDPRFHKYPRLPMLACCGYEKKPSAP
jgi:hypothetical protein